MENYKCNSFSEIEALISDLRNCYFGFLAFRGQPVYSWNLQTRVAATFKDLGNNCVLSNAKEIFELFKAKTANNHKEELFVDSFSYQPPNFTKDWYLLYQAQHLEVPTLLMDWSFEWQTAMFFAAFDDNYLNDSGSLFILNTSNFERAQGVYTINPFEINNYRLINPTLPAGEWVNYHALLRIGYQKGMFICCPISDCITPIDQRPELNDVLFKVEITPECKAEIIEKYSTPQEVHETFKNLNGVYEADGKFWKKYNKDFFYGNSIFKSEKMKNTVNEIRAEFGFQRI